MSVTVRPYVTGGWEVDIRVVLPDGTVIRERKKAQQPRESSARRWAEARERDRVPCSIKSARTLARRQ